MGDGDHVSRVVQDRLWDGAGREWTTKHTAWVTLKQANAFARRAAGGGVLDGPGRSVRWLSGQEMAQWWTAARDHFEVPGQGGEAARDELGRTWTAHLWRREGDKLIVFEANC